MFLRAKRDRNPRPSCGTRRAPSPPNRSREDQHHFDAFGEGVTLLTSLEIGLIFSPEEPKCISCAETFQRQRTRPPCRSPRRQRASETLPNPYIHRVNPSILSGLICPSPVRPAPRCAKSDGPSPPSARRRRAMAGALSAVGGSFPDRLLLGLNDDKLTGVARPPPSSAPSPSGQPADAFLFTKV
jgi:hypothetical protein